MQSTSKQAPQLRQLILVVDGEQADSREIIADNRSSDMKLVVLVVGLLGALPGGIVGKQQCGTVIENRLFDADFKSEPAENPWIGLLMEMKSNSFVNAQCNVIIVNELHVVTTAKCVTRFKNRTELAAVRLGIWDETHSIDEEYNCNGKGFCVPRPAQHMVESIKVHPQANLDTHHNDVAVLRLKERIEWTSYIQPLCMEPISDMGSLISRNFQYAGFSHYDIVKGKGSAFTISKRYCVSRKGIKDVIPEHHICAVPQRLTQSYDGTVLMGLNIKMDKPHSYYLAGILVDSIKSGESVILIFHDMSPLRSWLTENTRI